MEPNNPPPTKRVRIALVEDEPLYRDLLVRAFANTDDIEVADTFSSGEEAIAAYQVGDRLASIDVAVLDIQLAGQMNGLQTAHQLRRLHPDLGILLFSNHRHPAFIAALQTYESRGFSYLLKRSVHDFDTVRRAVRGVAEGSVVIDRLILEKGDHTQGKLSGLTERQLEILHLLAQGYSNQEIARQLCLSTRTIENHLARLYREMGCDTTNDAVHVRVQAVVEYLKACFAFEFGRSS